MAKAKGYFYNGVLEMTLVKSQGDGDIRAIFDTIRY